MIRESLQSYLKDKLISCELDRMTDQFVRYARECVYMIGREEAGMPRIGASKIGGLPDLPDDFEWPHGIDIDGSVWGYGSFLLQLNLSDIPAFNDLILPRDGFLWVFVQNMENPRKIRVIGRYRQVDASALSPRQEPTSTEWCVGKTSGLGGEFGLTAGTRFLNFELGVSLPIGKLGFEEELGVGSLDDLISLDDELVPAGKRGRLGGYAYNLEYENHQLHAALNKMGLPDYMYPYNYPDLVELAKGRSNPHIDPNEIDEWQRTHDLMIDKVNWIQNHRNELDQWQLFLTLSSDYDIDLDWGGASWKLWTFINTADVAKRQFDCLESVVAY